MIDARPIPGFPGYAITRNGVVWSLPRRNRRTPIALSYYIWGKYARVGMRVNGNFIRRAVHRLVLETFVGPCPEGMEACHNNGIRSDNRLENLRWGTRSANNLDAVRHGTASGLLSKTPGSKSGRAKLNELDVRWMRYLWRAGVAVVDLSDAYHISKPQVYHICNRKGWTHI